MDILLIIVSCSPKIDADINTSGEQEVIGV